MLLLFIVIFVIHLETMLQNQRNHQTMLYTEYTQHISFCQGKDYETVYITIFLRVIIETMTFAIGIDCPDVRQAIHWSVPEDAEIYVQESGEQEEMVSLLVLLS